MKQNRVYIIQIMYYKHRGWKDDSFWVFRDEAIDKLFEFKKNIALQRRGLKPSLRLVSRVYAKNNKSFREKLEVE